ncbi:MAG: lipoyl protein ligase domain-containing protein [Elusimicrobiales bacterium]
MEKGLIIETQPLDVYGQMAADEALCETLPAPYVLRFYNWKEPGITFGYSQRRKAVQQAVDAAGCRITAVTRRPTGGGIVFHETDLTFSFIFPSPGAYFEPGKTYDRLHRAINAEYARLGVTFDLLNEKTRDYAVNDPVMNCFSKPVDKDILYNGKKVLGGALRKFGEHMLYQASFQAPDARANTAMHRNAVIKALGGEFGLQWEAAAMTAETANKAAVIAGDKYRTPQWNERI